MSLSGPASPRAADPNRITRSGRKYSTTASSNSGGTEPVVIGVQPRESPQAGGSGSCLVARRQAQAGQKQLALLRVTQWNDARYHDGGNGLEPCDDLSRFGELPHMSIAGREKTIDHCKT